MDHREFNHTGFLDEVKQRIDRYFNDNNQSLSMPLLLSEHCEKQTLVSADYMFVARKVVALTSNNNNSSSSSSTSSSTNRRRNNNIKILDERVLDLIIERKNVNDMQQCLILKSKKYPPLTFFEAQMYKLQKVSACSNNNSNSKSNNTTTSTASCSCCGFIRRKIFLMEGDEDDPSQFWDDSDKTNGRTTKAEHEKRLKRVKTMRLQLEKGEWPGVKLVCTRNKDDTVKYLIDQMVDFQRQLNVNLNNELNGNVNRNGNRNFDLSHRPKMEHVKRCVENGMKDATFQEYLRLRKIKGVGDAKAMKAILMDPENNALWDKSFTSPSCLSRKTKATLDDRPTFYVSPTSSASSFSPGANVSSEYSIQSNYSSRSNYRHVSSSTSSSRRNSQSSAGRRSHVPRDKSKSATKTVKNGARYEHSHESSISSFSTSTSTNVNDVHRPPKKKSKTTPTSRQRNDVSVNVNLNRNLNAGIKLSSHNNIHNIRTESQIYRSELGLTSPEVIKLLADNSSSAISNLGSRSNLNSRSNINSNASSVSVNTVTHHSSVDASQRQHKRLRSVSKPHKSPNRSRLRPIEIDEIDEIDLTRSPSPSPLLAIDDFPPSSGLGQKSKPDDDIQEVQSKLSSRARSRRETILNATLERFGGGSNELRLHNVSTTTATSASFAVSSTDTDVSGATFGFQNVSSLSPKKNETWEVSFILSIVVNENDNTLLRFEYLVLTFSNSLHYMNTTPKVQ